MPSSVCNNPSPVALPWSQVPEGCKKNTPPNMQQISAVLQQKFGDCLMLHGFAEYSAFRDPSVALPDHVPPGYTRLALAFENDSPVLRVTSNLFGVQTDVDIPLLGPDLLRNSESLPPSEVMSENLYRLLQAAVAAIEVSREGGSVASVDGKMIKTLFQEIAESPCVGDPNIFYAEDQLAGYNGAQKRLADSSAEYSAENGCTLNFSTPHKRLRPNPAIETEPLLAASRWSCAAPASVPLIEAVASHGAGAYTNPAVNNVPNVLRAPASVDLEKEDFKRQLLAHLTEHLNGPPLKLADTEKYPLFISGLEGMDELPPSALKSCIHIDFSREAGSKVVKVTVNRFQKNQMEAVETVETRYSMGEEALSGGNSYDKVFFSGFEIARKMLFNRTERAANRRKRKVKPPKITTKPRKSATNTPLYSDSDLRRQIGLRFKPRIGGLQLGRKMLDFKPIVRASNADIAHMPAPPSRPVAEPAQAPIPAAAVVPAPRIQGVSRHSIAWILRDVISSVPREIPQLE